MIHLDCRQKHQKLEQQPRCGNSDNSRHNNQDEFVFDSFATTKHIHFVMFSNYITNLLNPFMAQNYNPYSFQIQMELKSFKCPKHKQNQVAFFCTVNQWHFVPLCSQCIPPHTQNHPKNFKISIEAYSKVRQKAMAQQKSGVQQYKKRLIKISGQIKQQSKPEAYKTLQQAKNKIIEIVNKYFEEIKKSLDERLQQTLKFQKQLLLKLQTNVKADIQDLENTDDINEVEQWAEVVKRLYFKDGITPYLEEIDDLMKDHDDRVYKRKDICDINIKKIEEDIKKILNGSVYLSKQNKGQLNEEKSAKTIPTKDLKKQPKIVIKPKICKTCGGELEYLTQLKKHLYCPNCGGKERNYVPKKP